VQMVPLLIEIWHGGSAFSCIPGELRSSAGETKYLVSTWQLAKSNIASLGLRTKAPVDGL